MSKECVVNEESDPLGIPGPNLTDHNKVSSGATTKVISTPVKGDQMTNGSKDHHSKLGRFGWCDFTSVYLPTLYRANYDEVLVSVRMVERFVLSKLINLLPYEVVTCPVIHSFRLTDVEARLLNEINIKHSDWQYGKDNFTSRDLLVKKSDVHQFHQFLEMSHRKMFLKEASDKDKCGFLRIGGASDVPYVEVKGSKFLPVFYFHGEVDHSQCIIVSSWDWAYLRFCCKVQGVKDELIASDCCEVIELELLKDYFLLGTTFMEYWPSRDFISRVKSKTNIHPGTWTRVVTNPEDKKWLGKLTLIKEFPVQQSSAPPYRAQVAAIDNKTIKCINIKPYEFKELMVTLPHLVELFPSFNEAQVGDMLVSHGVVLYKGNRGHEHIIKQEGWEDKYEKVPFVTVKDILKNLQFLKKTMKFGEQSGKRSKGI